MMQLVQRQNKAFREIEELIIKIFFTKEYFDKLNDNIEIGAPIVVYLTIALIILYGIGLLFSFFDKTTKLAQIVMMISCLVLIAIAIAFIFWNFGIAELSGLCGLVREVATGNTSAITEVGASERFVSFAESCAISTSKDDFITKNFKTKESLNVYLDYQNYLNTLILY